MKNLILVPKGKSPLKVLEEMGEQTRNSWIYFHRNAVDSMFDDADRAFCRPKDSMFCIWNKSNEDIILRLDIKTLESYSNPEWIKTLNIESSNIAFRCEPADPDEVIFIKMMEE